MSFLDNNSFDVLSPADILAANPGGIPQAVSMPGGTPFTINIPTNSYPGTGAPITGANLSNGIQGTTISVPGGSTATPNTTASNPTANAAQNAANTTPSIAPGSLADYFARAIIIVLGFIFIAVGLNMLKPGLVPNPVRAARV